MSLISKFKENNTFWLAAILRRLWWLIPNDKLYLQMLYPLMMHHRLNLNNPQTFNEKLQWLKLYNRNPLYTKLVDKYEVKKYVAAKIGKEFVIPTIGVWERPEYIDWDSLPDQFVLKTTHGGGNTGVVVCKDKNTFDREKALKKLKASMSSDIYHTYREWPYKNVHKRIIAEKYLEDESGQLEDYKFTCANGVAYNVMLCYDRGTGDTKFYFFDSDWNLLRINKRGKAAPEDFSLLEPKNIKKMFELAGKLSEGLPYARVDMYNVNGKIYFGEITFYPQSGFDPNLLPETDKQFGDLIDLDIISNKK